MGWLGSSFPINTYSLPTPSNNLPSFPDYSLPLPTWIIGQFCTQDLTKGWFLETGHHPPPALLHQHTQRPISPGGRIQHEKQRPGSQARSNLSGLHHFTFKMGVFYFIGLKAGTWTRWLLMEEKKKIKCLIKPQWVPWSVDCIEVLDRLRGVLADPHLQAVYLRKRPHPSEPLVSHLWCGNNGTSHLAELF